MMRALLAVLALAAAARLPAQTTVRITDVGPGSPGRILRQALAQPHELYLPTTGRGAVHLRRDTIIGRTVIVLGRPATVAATVHGDVIVVGGDLFLHPGAVIDGRAVAIGGGVYNSTLAVVRGGHASYRDETFAITRQAGGAYALAWRRVGGRLPPPVSLPGLYGLRFPAYDRVDGTVMPWGPTAELHDGTERLDVLATYRSNLGAVDPSLDGHAELGRRAALDVRAGRMTLTNDGWIWSDLVNSFSTIGIGLDTRNYYRADRAEATLTGTWEWATGVLQPFVGGAAERGWSTGGDSAARPWSVIGRTGIRRMLRPNPPVDRGTIVSALAGGTMHWEDQGIITDVTVRTEVAPRSPLGERFVQTTGDVAITFPTFRAQRLTITSHIVTTGGRAPRQRWAYLGGAGTLPTFRLLQFGGDELLFIDGRYDIPLDRLVIRYLGAPTVTLRYATGTAGVGRLPPLEQNVGLALAINLLRIDYLVDPKTRDDELSVGVSVYR